MASVITIISCNTSTTYSVNYTGSLLQGGIYYAFTFNGSLPSGCYEYIGLSSQPATDTVASVSYGYPDCITCQAVTPTPNNGNVFAYILNITGTCVSTLGAIQITCVCRYGHTTIIQTTSRICYINKINT